MRAGERLRQIDRRLLPLLVDVAVRLTQRPMRPQVLLGVAVLAVSAVLVTAVWAADRTPDGGVGVVGDIVQVGVAEGESIPDYLRAADGELDAMAATPPTADPVGSAQTYALVVFGEYLPPDRLASVLAGVSVVEVYTRVPLADTQTQVVRMPAFRLPEDVLIGMDQVAERKQREASDYRVRAADLGRAADLDLWRLYDTGARVATAEAQSYRAHCACVYAAVVQGDPDGLRSLAGLVEVRAVDPAPEVHRLDRAVFLPPLPEYVDVVPAGDDSLTTGGLIIGVPAGSGPVDSTSGNGRDGDRTSDVPALDGGR
ncbi:hypothetical protein O7632_14790 [Solwaraspora sp. WMMD406]|uniref:hypothetical protein n=1 Tax=Solwaraspora sp. WMMD406 TaxID=3016095 RepID=UPI002415E322|nr:hypothetical protein [Solwaraspora sp. WMMD406]MDG4765351.1 hypothetical protein [Solwaraspora sp. WMMD406]